ncbi:conserved hypothetical 76.2 kDa membrane protein [Thiorhodococcus drewsii AZ1]|uniref:Conserved hypothetical 76.2 kDa membrane protein n=1 Tax=Thiorhodococcus drewsii AZ1 TaxID=765913 RepID=G2E404_9GAMM|nr:patatin-like phospholipase family protein [Thiorhodococcus drewsii]EGV29897.1 conserved hypothetical 76.2 kDa membrane protein [Thiorhodococcus drewsii AZ1]
MRTHDDRTFGIGLVMAGAVSAGAYTAGVLDFLMQALAAWERAKAEDPDGTPDHAVQIQVLTGASAGALSGALLVSSLRDADYPSPDPVGDSHQYRAWVDKIDISGLLTNDDLEGDRAVRSVLNATLLDGIADELIGGESGSRGDEPLPPFVADPLPLYLTVTNLRGVPYSIRFRGESGNAYGMSMHADHMQFHFGQGGGEAEDGSIALRVVPGLSGSWALLKESALASAAFPIGLAARVLERTGTLAYDARRWPIPIVATPEPGQSGQCTHEETIPPAWPDPWPANQPPREDWTYSFVNLDGGLANNEPFELARRALAGEDGRNPRGGQEANRAVIMIDPFPAEAKVQFDYRPDTGLLSVLSALMGAVKAQLRFKLEELELASSEQVFSRFIVSPVRSESSTEFALASGGLNGFGGFLARAFREHDYQLGRRNCQQFLRRHFVLEVGNPLFAHWTQARPEPILRGDGHSYLPIIPLIGECAIEVPEPVWPCMTESQFETLSPQVRARADALVMAFIRTQVNSAWDRFLLQAGWRFFAWRKRVMGGDVVEPILGAIRKSLTERGLI